MKLKKYISKLLFCSILFNNMYFLSNAASNSNLNRYKTFESEFIDLGDVGNKEIVEIETFGNTIQNADNLEDIQSVGNLYVDDEGQPILDKQGQKQYKFDIVSIGKNVFDINNTEFIDCAPYIQHSIMDGVLELTSINPTFNGFITKDGLLFQNGSQYTLSYDIETNEDGDLGVTAQIVDEDGLHYTVTNGKPISFVANGKMSLRFYTNVGACSGTIIRKFSNIQIEKGPLKTNYEFYKKNITKLLLPTQLEKVGQVSDKLYYDKTKRTWCIEKNISQHIFDNDTFYINEQLEDFTGAVYKIDSLKCGWGVYTVLINGKKTKNNFSWETLEKGDIYTTSDSLVVLYPKGTTYEDIKKDMKHRQLKFITETPSKIILPKSTQISLDSFIDSVYIFAGNNSEASPTFKITVDRILQLSQDAVDSALSTPTSSNIALARMYVNLLSESLYKDQLQAKLNNVFSEDMVLDRLSATANLDVYIQSENILMMSLDTNTVTFEDYSGVEELELQNAINISINSSLPYQLNAYIVGEITNKDKNKTLDLDVLNIKDSNELEYKKFDSINNKLVLLDNVSKGNCISHSIDLKLSGNKAHDADVYKTTIKFEAEQK